MTRVPLPNRRPAVTLERQYRGSPITVTVGFDPSGLPKEVFASGFRGGSDMAHVLADACVEISIALQHGVSPAELSISLGRVPAWFANDAGEVVETLVPASPVGVIVACLMEVFDELVL